jgi:hypothetical protein
MRRVVVVIAPVVAGDIWPAASAAGRPPRATSGRSPRSRLMRSAPPSIGHSYHSSQSLTTSARSVRIARPDGIVKIKLIRVSEISVPVALTIFGALLIAAAVFGGFQAKELDIPPLPPRGRIPSGVLGGIFIVASIWLYLSPPDEPKTIFPPPAQTIAAAGTTATTAPTTSSIPPTSTTARRGLNITAPPDLAKISGKKGAFIEGTAVGLQNEFVWVFDLDTDNRTYYRDHEHPLDVIDDKWAFNDAPIGSDSDPLGSTTVIVVIRASES